MNLSDTLDNSVSPPSLFVVFVGFTCDSRPTFEMLLNRKLNEGFLGNEVQFTHDAGVVSIGDCLKIEITMRDREGSTSDADSKLKRGEKEDVGEVSFEASEEGKLLFSDNLDGPNAVARQKLIRKSRRRRVRGEKTTFCFRSPQSLKRNQTLKPLTTRDHNERQSMIVKKVRFPVDTNCVPHSLTFIDCEEENVKQRRLQLIEAFSPGDLKLQQ